MPRKILIVDDDLDDQQFLLEAVTELFPASTNIVANNGKEAIDYVDKNPPPPSLIFLDLNMPLLNGYEFLSLYKERPGYKNSHIIIYTTSSNPHDREMSKECGATEFMTKEADIKLLKKKIKEVVARIE